MSSFRVILKNYLRKARQRNWDAFFISGVLICLLVFSTLGQYRGAGPDLKTGDIAFEDISVRHDVDILDRGQNQEQVRQVRRETAPVFLKHPDVALQAEKDLNFYFSALERITASTGIRASEKRRQIRQINTNLSQSFISWLDQEADQSGLKKAALSGLSQLYKKGIVEESSLYQSSANQIIQILYPETGESELIPLQIFYHQSSILSNSSLAVFSGKNKTERAFLKDLYSVYVRPDIIYDIQRTAQKVESRIREFEPVTRRLRKGMVIIHKGEEVTEEIMDLLNQVSEKTRSNRAGRLFGVLFLYAVIFFLIFYPVRELEPDLLRSKNRMIMLLLILFLHALLCFYLQSFGVFWGSNVPRTVLIPIVLSAIVLPVLFRFSFTLLFLPVLVLLAGLIFGGSVHEYLPVFLTGYLGLYLSRGIRRRSLYWLLGVFLVAGNSFFLVISGLLSSQPFPLIIEWVYTSALITSVSVVLATGLLFLFEVIFNLATDYRLLELCDLNRPLFRSMLIKAPGTYHHSVLVSNLAESAAFTIGARSLLVKVAAYYHDMGKMAHPEYFVENSKGHKMEVVRPTLSVAVVKAHLKESVERGRQLHLPEEVIEILSQHHGRSLIRYFYYKALKQADADRGSIRKEDFIYPGQNPRTQEAAILLLADSVEAAARTLRNPTHQRLKNLVEEIMNSKFSEGLLNEAEISLRDVSRIGEAFVKVLTGIYHTRVNYPREDEIGQAEQSHAQQDKT